MAAPPPEVASEAAHQFERDVEQRFRRSPAVIRDES
jgi:hypothetical protein